MEIIMKAWKRKLVWLLCAAMLTLSVSLPVLAEEDMPAVVEEKTDPEDLPSEEAQSLVQAVAKQLGLYGRYESISERSLYKAAVERLIEEDPALYGTVLKAMLESVDEHSEYYTAEEAKGLMESINGEVVGIGVTIDFSNPAAAVIASVIPDTPADQAGLQVGDILVSADGTDLRGMKSESILKLVRGEAGTPVRLEVERDGAVLSYDLIREAIIGTSVTAEVFEEDGQKLMYIRVFGFVKNTAEKFKVALDQADQAGITNLIIDLRDNGGGILDQAVQMAGCFCMAMLPLLWDELSGENQQTMNRLSAQAIDELYTACKQDAQDIAIRDISGRMFLSGPQAETLQQAAALPAGDVYLTLTVELFGPYDSAAAFARDCYTLTALAKQCTVPPENLHFAWDARSAAESSLNTGSLLYTEDYSLDLSGAVQLDWTAQQMEQQTETEYLLDAENIPDEEE